MFGLKNILNQKETKKFDLNECNIRNENKDFKINIVTESPENKWVLRMMSERWAQFLKNCTVSSLIPDLSADINFYVNWDIYKEPSTIDVGWFTHREADLKAKKRFNKKAKEMDFCICPSINTYKLLPKEKTHVLKHGVGEEYKKQKDKISFGIVAREYSSGRKKIEILEELKKIPFTEFIFTNGKLSTAEMPDFYKKIDYLLVTSNNEGGPVPVLEAFTMGVPVIAPDVGWCWEYPVIRYDNHDHLKDIVRTISKHINVDSLWQESSNELYKVFNYLVNSKQKKLTHK